MSAVADKLDEARKLVEAGWAQGHFRHDGCYCAWGAILETCGGTPEYNEVKERFKEAAGYEAERYGLPWWNDREDRTKAQVIAAFKRAAKLARAQVSA